MSVVAHGDVTGAEVVHVELGERSYDIVVGDGQIDGLGERLRAIFGRTRVAVVTDTNVASLYLPRAEETLRRAGIDCFSVVLPAGERTKDFSHLQTLTDRLLEARVERATPLLALGGGVVGDIAGLAAGIVLRGLDYVQVPTTLLAQVDSSVGGKTGINTSQGKNLVGLFHQPRLVVVDVGTLRTLEPRQLRAGYAEVVKYGLLGDAQFFAWLETHGSALCEGDSMAQIHAVRISCAAKAAIVAADEREAGRRALLNLGHTFGHALEAETGYDGSLLHGEAVAAGMVLAFDLSVRLGLCPADDAARVRRHLEAVALPTGFATLPAIRWSADALIVHMTRDKKVRDGRIAFVLARGIGRAFVSREVEIDDVRRLLTDAIER